MNSIIKKIVVFFLSMLILITFVFGINITKSRDMYTGLPEDDKMIYGFIDREGNKLGKNYHMHYAGNGIGGMDKVWLMCLSFQRFGDLFSQEETRKLVVSCAIDYLEAINSDEKLRPFLRDYPFTAKNLKLAIYSYDRNGNEYLDPYIGSAGISEGKLFYYTVDPNTSRFKSKKYETYEEALAILKNENHQ